MIRIGIAIAGLVLLAGCGGGGDGSNPAAPEQGSQQPPPAQPDMLTATAQGLMRGKANGQGQQVIFRLSNMHQADVSLGNGHVYYHRDGPPVVNANFDNRDIWSVRADGTGDHAVLNTGEDEFIRAVNGAGAVYESRQSTSNYGSIRNGAPLADFGSNLARYIVIEGERVFTGNEGYVDSRNLDGSNPIVYLDGLFFPDLIANLYEVVDGRFLMRQFNAASGVMTVYSVPVPGGSRSPLGDGRSYYAYEGHVGPRVVLEQCVLTPGGPPQAGACDVVSMNTDGSGTATLTTHPANEAVQGIVGNQVIIRRNLSGNDHLIAVPEGGGPEKLLMTMTDSEFVETVIDDLIIVRRPSGTWTLDLNAKLSQLGTVALDFNLVEVGNSVCGNTVNAVWCLPLNGQGPAVKITDNGRVLGVL